MKRYDVIEAHIGDKDYAAGGTRIADEGTVAHLVEWGTLREAADQTNLDADVPVALTADDYAHQVEALTKERDEAREELGTMRDGRATAEADVTSLRSQIETLTKELESRPKAATPPTPRAAR